MTRQFERMVARKVAEFTVEKILGVAGRIPRRTRRFMGRVYGNAGWRRMRGVDTGSGYPFNPHTAVVGYIAEETKRTLDRLMQPEHELPPLPEGSTE